MPHASFVHLHVHSAYSLSEGALTVADIVARCVAAEMPAIAITDTGNLFGALEFSEAAAGRGVQPIVGCQIWVSPARNQDPAGDSHARALADRNEGKAPPPDELVLLVQSEAGYRNLSALSSMGFLETPAGEPPQVSLDDIAAHSDGLIALTGGPRGTVGRLVGAGQKDAAREVLSFLADAFAGRLYVEIMRHGMASEEATESSLIDLAFDLDLPLVATNDCYFGDPGMHEAHDALMCIAAGTRVSDTDRRTLTAQHGLRSPAEMRALFADLPEALDNTLVIARRCAYRPLPHAPMLPRFDTGDDLDEATFLKEQAEAGLEERLRLHVYDETMVDQAARDAAARPYRERLEFELGVIIDMGFPGYFLIVSDFIRWAKGQGIPVGPGRGSGAGSVAAWALAITDLDPLRFGLLFERFLNPERVSMPDFDIDFCQDRRDEVITYVKDKYGADRVTQIITFGKLQARAALRDVGRVLGMPYGQVDRISKLVPFNPANPPKLIDAIESEPQLRAMRDEDEAVARLLDIALKLEGLYRHASTHAAGVVIADRPLQELVPVYRDPRSDMAATQFSMKYAEMAGLVKFDFLGLKTLTVLQQAVQFIEARGESIDLATLPLDDTVSYELMTRSETVGVFQLESAGMRDALRQLKPDSFEDIIALVALYRPGPMENIPRYIARKHGTEQPDYLHPELEGILKETFGVIIYQEQVMQIAQVLSGFSLAKADLLRRAMGKKIKEEMKAQREAFVDGATARGVGAEQASRIFDLVDKFAGYGFNKSHAAAYALIAYQTAYLKANYPVEFMAALMTLDLGNTDKLTGYRQEVRRLGISLLPPDINRSQAEFSVEDQADSTRAVRYGLAALKNVGLAAMRELVVEREANGPFESVVDFARRIDAKALNKRQLENLVRAGAFDSLQPNRRQLFEAVEPLLKYAAEAAAERESAQENLFGGVGESDRDPLPLNNVPDWNELERLGEEFAAIGFYLSAHPLDSYLVTLKRLGVRSYRALSASGGTGGASHVKVAGLVLRKQERTSAKGNRFAFLQLSDAEGDFEATVFADVLAQCRELLEPGTMVLLNAEVRRERGEIRLTVQSIEALESAAGRAAAGLRITMRGAAPLIDLRREVAALGEGRGRITLALGTNDGGEVEIALPGHYAITPDVRLSLAAFAGIDRIEEV